MNGEPNMFDGVQVDTRGFAYRDLLGVDEWDTFTVSASLTEVGTTTYSGRYRIVGRQCFFQVKIVPETTIASTAGTHYITLPITAEGFGGVATMTNDTTNVAVGTCHIDVANSRCYTPTQSASGNTFLVNGWFEV